MARTSPRDEGSAAVEFVLVSLLLTIVTLAVIQLGFGLYVRNVLIAAASEGARHASLADTRLEEGAQRSAELIRLSLGSQYPVQISAAKIEVEGVAVAVVSVRATLPIIGLLGFAEGLEVTGRAPMETISAG